MRTLLRKLLMMMRPRQDESDLVLDVERMGVVHSTIDLVKNRTGGFDLRGRLHFNEARDPDGDQWRYYVKDADLIAMAEGCALEYESIAFKEEKGSITQGTIEREVRTERKTAKNANASGEIGGSLTQGFNAGAKASVDASVQINRAEASKETYGQTLDKRLITLTTFSAAGRFVSWHMRPDLADTKECLGEHVAVLHGEWLALPKGERLGHVKLHGPGGRVELFLEIRGIALSRWSPVEQTQGASKDPRARVSERSLSKAVTKRFPLGTLACGSTTMKASQ